MALPSPTATSAALVTGASSGIGAAIARELATRGHQVILVARREDKLTELADELASAHGVRAEVLGCDLTDPEARDGLGGRIAGLGLDVEILVNNAGYGSLGAFTELDGPTEVAMVRLNCEAVVALTHRFAPAMVQRSRGAILTVASSAGFQPLPSQATYGASKAFAVSFSEALHAELSGSGIAVTALCPGPVRTEFMEVADMDDFAGDVPSIAWQSAETCAAQAVRGLERNKRIVVPGLPIRAMTIAGRLTPRAILLPVLRRAYPT